MILMTPEIMRALDDGRIHMHPLDKSLVSVNSIDVAVGSEGYYMGAHNDSHTGRPYLTIGRTSFMLGAVRNLYVDAETYKPTNKSRSIFPITDIPRTTVGDLKAALPIWVPPPGATDEMEVLLLETGSSYLLTTLHAIGTRFQGANDPSPCLVPVMKAKSTAGRLGLSVSLCAGVGELGYHSRWALECRVAPAQERTLVPLVVGTVIAHVLFLEGNAGNAVDVEPWDDVNQPFEQGLRVYGGPDSYQPSEEAPRILPKPLKIVSYPPTSEGDPI